VRAWACRRTSSCPFDHVVLEGLASRFLRRACSGALLARLLGSPTLCRGHVASVGRRLQLHNRHSSFQDGKFHQANVALARFDPHLMKPWC
jgi:hypothetical protein